MDDFLLVHNTHWNTPDTFADADIHLRRLKQLYYSYLPPLLEELPTQTPGIYTLGGGRQIGKTTLLKQWMLKLINSNIPPQQIIYLTGEVINDHHHLIKQIHDQLKAMDPQSLKYLIIDEVTYIKDWDKAIKFSADAGFFENTIVLLSGSDLVMVKEARMRFPGRRGTADKVDFHFYPLSFKEVFTLKKRDESNLDLVFDEFNHYLMHGGFLPAINDLAMHGCIKRATLSTYSDWIRGDMLRRGKNEIYLKELLKALISRYTSQLSWNSLEKDLSIEHPQTVSEYVSFLESMAVLFVQMALREDKLAAAPKKAKKIIFCDPFIYHALYAWLWECEDPFVDQIKKHVADSKVSSQLVEACVTSHYARYFPTYYIKADAEIDIAYVHQKSFWPIEVKWTSQLRPKDLKQIAKYPNSRLLMRQRSNREILGISAQPVPLGLLELG